MKKSVTANYIYNLLFQMLTLLFPVVTTPYLSRVLGVEKIGIFSYTLSITTYFVLISSLGISLYGQREIAYVQDNKVRMSKIFNNLFFVRLLITLLTIVLFIVYIIVFPEYKLFYMLWIIEIIGTLFDISWFYQGIEQFKKIIFRNFMIKVMSTALIFIFIKTQDDLYKYILIYSSTTLFGNLSLWFYISRYVSFRPFSIENLKMLRFHLASLLVFFIPQLATKIYTVLDKSMIGMIVKNKNKVGYYEQSQKVVYLLLTVLTSLGVVMMTRIANLFANKKSNDISETIKKSFKFVLLVGIPLSLGSIILAKYLIPLYLGEGYDKSVILMQILSPIIIIVGMSNVTGVQLLIPLKRQKQYNISVVAGAIINLILNAILINRYSSVGAAIATVISEFIILYIQVRFVNNIVDIKYIIISSWKYYIAGLIMFVMCLLINILFHFSICLMLITVLFMGIISYFSILLLLKEDLIFYFIKKIKNAE